MCRRLGVSRKTGYKWCRRFAADGEAGLRDQPRRTRRRGHQTSARMEQWVLTLRRKHPTWSPRKLQRRLHDLGRKALPALSTFARILRRTGCIDPLASRQHRPMQRFSRAVPHELWPVNFKGHFALSGGGRCHPSAVLDDCSRYSLGLQARADEQTATVQQRLARIIGVYGLREGKRAATR
jgi:transposase InsO family protein